MVYHYHKDLQTTVLPAVATTKSAAEHNEISALGDLIKKRISEIQSRRIFLHILLYLIFSNLHQPHPAPVDTM